MDFSLRVERTFNTSDIEKIIYHPEVIRLSTENGEKGEIDVNGNCWIGTYIDNKMVGVFVFEPLNKVTLDGHCYFLPEYRKKVSSESYDLSVELVFKESDYKKIIVKCNSKDWHIKNFCLNRAFHLEGLLEKSAMVNNKLVDEYILGITKGQFLEYMNV